MRIRTRIVLFSIAVTTIALALTATLLILFVRKTTVEAITSTAVVDATNFTSFFQREKQEEAQMSKLLGRTYGLYRFRKLAMHEQFTLHNGEEYLYNAFGFEPESVLNEEKTSSSDSLACNIIDFHSTRYAIVVSHTYLDQFPYTLCLVRDVTETFRQMNRIQWYCVALTAIVAAMAAVLVWLGIRNILSPIGTLRRAAADIASGHYRNRIAVRGKDELSELAEEFNRMADAVEQHTEALSERNERQQMFINDLSHELKTPITSILLNSETLLKRRVSREEQMNALASIYDQGQWLERLSQKLMTLVMLQGEIDRVPTPVSELIKAVEESTRIGIEEQGMHFSATADESEIRMDFDLMRSAVANLVENAKRASEPGNTIWLSALNRTIVVRDEGKGIPESELERITEPFYMVDRSRSKKKGGSGLGLALVKEIVGAHHGRMWIESTVGAGTTITLFFGE